jgi:hypothetical protein
MPLAQASILIFGRAPQLLETRRLILERAGARVWTAAELSDIKSIAHAVSIDLVILCHSLSMEQCGRALALASTLWPQVKSLNLSSGCCECNPEISERVVDANRGPAHLLDAVANLIGAEQANHHRTKLPRDLLRLPVRAQSV